MHAQHFSALLLCGLATACPMAARQAATATAAAPGAGTTGTGSGVDMVAAIQAIMPTSGSCPGGNDECRTAKQAAPFISKACADLSDGECAATLALIGLESGDLKYKHNIGNGVPGQGTANMMSPTYVSQYATALFGAGRVSGKSPVEVLALVTPDEYNFGSAAWYLTTVCTAEVRSSLKTGTDAAWAAYSQCVGATDPDGRRMNYWIRAKAAFKL